MYLFTSERLGFRNWLDEDLAEFTKMNADPAVMEHFPSTLTMKESADLLVKLQRHYEKHGYTYFATELLDTEEFIGFIGLAYQEYQTDFNPATDIGWRLKKSAWGFGYATEGATRCLSLAFKDLKLEKVLSVCVTGNIQSQKVMHKIGMTKKGTFYHPNLADYPALAKCYLYKIERNAYNSNSLINRL